ncbi:MAG: flagellar hook-associated protein FlgL [Thermodesulfobacteriota bacterium]|nr:flagellar hook-associated protein FlgL [Thermodesulfobacteriota bacterium]
MRVPSKTIYDMVTFHLGNISEELNIANEIVTTTKRINDLSDDPVGLTQALNIKSSLAGIMQLERNITMGKSWLTASESALSQVQDLISDTKSLCVKMSTATTGASERAAAAQIVQNTMDEIISLANTEVNGRYVFAGSETDTAPFSQNGAYNGDNNAFTIKIGKDATIVVGCDGEAVFQPSGAGSGDDIFQTLSDLKTVLENNNISGIQDAMTKLDNHIDYISTRVSDIGSKMLRMEIKEKVFQDLNITNTDRLSKIEDADITEAIINLKEKEMAYQAALASSSKVMSLSLVDYLK